ncbi:MAG: hypothetical protein WDA20_03630 [Desulfuromonadales bacterium]
MNCRFVIKRLMLGLALLAVSPLILLARLGLALGTDAIFNIGAQTLALVPALPGSFLRVAFYKGTLKRIGSDVRISFGSYFSKSSAALGNWVNIGAYCILGNVEVHDEVLIASRVSLLSGKYEHGSAFAPVSGGGDRPSEGIRVGAKTWIGEGAIIAADVGGNCLVATGTVVTRPVPDGTMAAGNPMKLVKMQPFIAVVPNSSGSDRLRSV